MYSTILLPPGVNPIAVNTHTHTRILWSYFFIYRSLCKSRRLYFIVNDSSIEVYVPISICILQSVFSSIEVYVLINLYILYSDVFIDISLCINIRLYFIVSVFIYRSLCTNKRVYFIVRYYYLQKPMCQYTCILYSQKFSSIEHAMFHIYVCCTLNQVTYKQWRVAPIQRLTTNSYYVFCGF